MKGGAEKFVPAEADADDEEEALDDAPEGGGVDALLGNAFDASQDGDREGFVRSMRAAIAASKE